MEIKTDIEVCNELLSWELSAVETYSQAIDFFHHAAVRPILEEVRTDHAANADRLRGYVKKLGGLPASSRKAWTAFVENVQGNGRLFGERSALAALLEGEEWGEAEYAEALRRDFVVGDGRDLIREVLLPRLQRHVSTLRGLTATR